MSRTLLIVAFALAATPAFAAPLAPGKPSDVRNVFVDDLTACPGGNGRVVTRTYDAAGTVIQFTIPPKQVFVVTQVDWYIDGATASQTHTLNFTVYPSGGQQQTLLIDGATADAAGKIRKVTPTAPLVIPSGAIMCARSSSGSHGAFVHGFLTKAK